MMAADAALLRRAIAIAERSRARGNHPFGALLAGPDGSVLLEAGNGADSGDRTAHAERTLMSEASKRWSAEFLAECTMFTSAEPCAMCSGALYWAGVGRVVFGQTEKDLKAATGAHEENPTLDLPCQIVFAAGQRPTEIVGPLLEAEAAKLQSDFWSARHD